MIFALTWIVVCTSFCRHLIIFVDHLISCLFGVMLSRSGGFDMNGKTWTQMTHVFRGHRDCWSQKETPLIYLLRAVILSIMKSFSWQFPIVLYFLLTFLSFVQSLAPQHSSSRRSFLSKAPLVAGSVGTGWLLIRHEDSCRCAFCVGPEAAAAYERRDVGGELHCRSWNETGGVKADRNLTFDVSFLA